MRVDFVTANEGDHQVHQHEPGICLFHFYLGLYLFIIMAYLVNKRPFNILM